MDMSKKLEHAFHNVVLLHSLKDAPPELHKAILDDKTSEDELHGHLAKYAKQLHSNMQASANGESAPDEKGSTASRTLEFLRGADNAEPSKSDEADDRERTASRQKRVGKIFGK